MYNSNMNRRPFGSGGQGSGPGMSVSEEMMERDNQESISRLGDRVKGLKEVMAHIPFTIRVRGATDAFLLSVSAFHRDRRLAA